MQFEITTAEAANVFSVTRKTIADWRAKGIMVKTSDGKYNLRESLRNFIEYRDVLREGGDLDLWWLRCEQREYEREHPPIDWSTVDMSKIELTPLKVLDAPMKTFEVETDAEGRIQRASSAKCPTRTRGRDGRSRRRRFLPDPRRRAYRAHAPHRAAPGALARPGACRHPTCQTRGPSAANVAPRAAVTPKRIIEVEGIEARLAELEANARRLMSMVLLLGVRLSAVETRQGVECAPSIDDVTVKTAAHRTGFSPSAVRKWIKQKRVVSKRYGGRVLVDARSLPAAKR